MSLISQTASFHLKPKPKHLILHVTDKCNLRCSHCFVDLKTANTITTEKAQEVANDMGKFLWLDIGGGEPFLLDNLDKIIAPFNCEIVGIPSNGFYPEQVASMTLKILKTTQANDLVISISLEGPEDIHNKIRNNAQSYNKAIETLKLLHDIAKEHPRLKVKCNTVISRNNVNQLIDFMKYIQNTGLVDFHSIILLRGTPRELTELPPFSKLQEIHKDLFSILDQYLWGNKLFSRTVLRKYYHFLWDISIKTLEQKRQVIPCKGGQTHLVIWANGDVSSCEMLPTIGNIYQHPLNQILYGVPMRQQIQSVRNKECYCTHNCVMLDSIFFNPIICAKMLLA